MNIKMIVTDLDRTLLRTDETISEYTKSVFGRCQNMGIKIVFATARSLEGSQDYRIALNPDGDIVTGGCLVFAGKQLLRSYYLPEPRVATLLAEICAYPLVTRVSARSLNTAYSNKLIEGKICIDFKSPLPEKLLHSSCCTDDGDFMNSIAIRYPEFSFLHNSGSDLYDINPKDATKFNGVKTISEYFNIPISEVIAFGDDYNDVVMLRDCGVGVAMNNAINECKTVADCICDTNENDGVAKWIEEKILT